MYLPFADNVAPQAPYNPGMRKSFTAYSEHHVEQVDQSAASHRNGSAVEPTENRSKEDGLSELQALIEVLREFTRLMQELDRQMKKRHLREIETGTSMCLDLIKSYGLPQFSL